GIVIAINGITYPCEHIDELHPGLRAALTHDRGGVYGRILNDGVIRLGDVASGLTRVSRPCSDSPSRSPPGHTPRAARRRARPIMIATLPHPEGMKVSPSDNSMRSSVNLIELRSRKSRRHHRYISYAH